PHARRDLLLRPGDDFRYGRREGIQGVRGHLRPIPTDLYLDSAGRPVSATTNGRDSRPACALARGGFEGPPFSFTARRVAATFPPVRPTTLGILGLGAIGGSVALQAKRAGIATVLGWSPEPAERAAAAQQGAVDDAPPRAADVARAVELLVLAAPPAANRDLLETLGRDVGAGSVITDVGSVKRALVATAAELGLGPRFAGGHPLAGTHGHGFGAARLDLFRGAVVYVTPTRGGDGAAREVAHFWESVLEAHPVRIDAAQHDRQLALTSHLPQAVA